MWPGRLASKYDYFGLNLIKCFLIGDLGKQKKPLEENYGKSDLSNAAKVKAPFHEITTRSIFRASSRYEKMMTSIEAHPDKAKKCKQCSCLSWVKSAGGRNRESDKQYKSQQNLTFKN